MCRLVAYIGNQPLLLSTLIADPENSLIKQSHAAKEGSHGINADGFGIAWYHFDLSSMPGIFRSIQPAWNDQNLIHIAQKVSSSCFLAHIRASTVGDVNQNNCHPFSYQTYAMVHNGTIRNFEKMKRRLLDEIDEALFLQIKGNTDSECFFFLIIHYTRHGHSLPFAVSKAISWIVRTKRL